MSDAEKKDWEELVKEELSKKRNCNPFRDRSYNTKQELKNKNYWQYRTELTVAIPFARALKEFDEKSNNFLLSISISKDRWDRIVSGGFEQCLMGLWGSNFYFCWYEAEIEQLLGRCLTGAEKQNISSVSLQGEATEEQRLALEKMKEERKSKKESREIARENFFLTFDNVEEFWVKGHEQLAKIFLKQTQRWGEEDEEKFFADLQEEKEKYRQRSVVVMEKVAVGFQDDLRLVRKKVLAKLGGWFEYYLKRNGQWVSIVFIIFFGVLGQLDKEDLLISKPILSVLFVLGIFLIVLLRK